MRLDASDRGSSSPPASPERSPNAVRSGLRIS